MATNLSRSRPNQQSGLSKTLIQHGKVPPTYKCGQEEKVVVVVGCTQHGKSSLIRSILDYGGYTSAADEVKCGAFGNDSTTKETKQFTETIKIRDHVLIDNDGRTRNINLEADEPADLYELFPSSKDSGRHIHLRIIDTPGLDDSENAKESNNCGTFLSLGPKIRVVDERHKLLALKAMADAGKIHAVCFVLDIGRNLGASVQTLLQEYMDIFQLSGLAKSYYFAHTKANIDKRFTKKARERPAEVDRLFGIAGRTKHHVVDNIPERDEISQHFSHWALAKLLTDLYNEKPQVVRNLKYPKTECHRFMDEMLKSSIMAQQAQWEAEIKRLDSKKIESSSTQRSLEGRRESEYNSWHELHQKVEELDTEELVLVGYELKSERAHLMSTSRLWFHVNAGTIIRDYKLDCCSDSHWSGGGPTKSDVVGKTSCSAILIGDAWFTPIVGSITLYGWKKEAKASELEALKKEKGSAWSDMLATAKNIARLGTEIEGMESQIKAVKSKLGALREQQGCLVQDFIPMDALTTRATYFASSSIVSYSVGLNIMDKIPKSLFFSTTAISGSTTAEKYGSRHSNCTSKLTIAQKARGRVADDKSKLSKSIKGVETNLASVNAAIDVSGTGLARMQDWEPSSSDFFNGAGEEDCRKALEELQAQTNPRIACERTYAEGLPGEGGEMLQERQCLLRKALTRLVSQIADAEKLESKLDGQIADLEATAAAANMVKILVDRSEYCAGILSALKQSADGGRADLWEDVFFHVKDVYRCDPVAFDSFGRMFA